MSNCLIKGLYHFAFQPAKNEHSCTLSPALEAATVCDFSHSDRGTVVSHFSLQFPDDI